MCIILSFLRLLKKLLGFIEFFVCSRENRVVGLLFELAWWSLHFFRLFKINQLFRKRQGLDTHITQMALFTFASRIVDIILWVILFLIRLVILGIVVVINGLDILSLLFCFYFLFGSVRDGLLSCFQIFLCLSSLQPGELHFGVWCFLVCLLNLYSALSLLLLLFGFHFV